MAGRAGGASRTSRLVAVAAVAALAAGAIALSALALQHADPDAPSGTPAPVPTFDLGVETGTALPPTPAPVADPVDEPPGAGERFLSIGSGGMWRATAGECGVTAPIVERSVDGGSTWTDVTPTYRGIGQVHRLDTFAGTEAEMVASMGEACEVQLLRTFTQGEFWEPYPEILTGSIYLAPDDPGVVITPGGELDAPCDAAWGLHAEGASAALICEGTAYQLADDRWDALTDAAPIALAFIDGEVVVAHEDPACATFAVTRFAAERIIVGCLDRPESGPIGLAALGVEVAAWSGDRVSAIGG